MLRPRLRVLALVHLPPPVHGASLVNQRLVSGRVARAVELRVVPMRFARTLEDLGRPGLRKLARATSYAARQVGRLARGGIDVGYITPSTRGGAMLRDALYMRVFRAFGVPFVAHVHTMGLPVALERVPAPARRFVRSAFRSAERVLALNQVHRGELAAVVDPERIEVVPNALPDEPAAAGAETDVARHRLLFLSNMVPEKGAAVFLDALPALRHAARGLTPTFAGAWPGAEARRSFHEHAGRLGVDDWIEVRGNVDESEKRALLRESLALVFPTHYPFECAPLVVLEAMRDGVAVVATRHAGIPELVEDGVSGVLVPPRDPHALAEAIGGIIADPDRAGRFGSEGRARFRALHTQERWERRMIEILGEVAEHRNSGRGAAAGAAA